MHSLKNMKPNVIAISYAKRALIPGSRERLRMAEYATVLESYHLIVFTRENEAPGVQEDGNLFLYSTNAKSKVGMVWRAFWIGRSILKKSPETIFVVSGQDPLEAGVVAWALSWYQNARLHIQMHGDVFSQYYFTNPVTRFIKQHLASFMLQHAKKVRVVSERIKTSLLSRGIKESRILVVPIQFDLDQFLQVGSARQYPNDVPVTCLYVGRFSSEKNLPLLLQAFKAAAEGKDDVRLQLLGDGPLKPALQEEVQALGIRDKVQFLPWSDGVPQFMAKADILCLASLHEGFAMVLVEAMAAGMPVVTTDVGCAGEWVKHGEAGLVVPIKNNEAYADALREMLQSSQLRERMGRTGHVAVQKQMLAHAEYLHAIQTSFTI